MSLQNVWHHRRVAAGSARACWICYKPSTSVLITPDNKDFFYICVGHLADKQFCRPDGEEAAAVEARKKKEELEREIEKVNKEYEEKQKLKKENREKRKGKDKDDKEEKKNDGEKDKDDEKTKDDKIEKLSKSKDEAQADLGPRIYSLNKLKRPPHLEGDPPSRNFVDCSAFNEFELKTKQELLSDAHRSHTQRRGRKTESREVEQPKFVSFSAQ